MEKHIIQTILSEIECANDAEIGDIIHAVIKRRKELHPDWELMLFSLPVKDTQKRQQCLDEIFSFLQEHPA